uniref:RNA-directed DNA polymerase n=1 Tax=Plectus sambesii TaxID=2011161 RepID=A0A914XA95_9BILA
TFILYTDASKVGLSAILSQKGGDGKIHPIAYACRRCSPAEQNYCATDLEAAALVFGVKRFDTYVRCYPLSVYTDHSALQALMTAKDPSARMIRWRIALQEYDLVIRYRAGRINTNADSLSRMFADEAGVEPTVAAAAAESQGTRGIDREPVSRVDLAHNRLTKMQRADPDYKPIWEFIESGALPADDKQARKIALQSHAFVVQDGLLYFVENGKSHRLRLAVPHSEREALVHENHGTGHLGEEKVFGLLAQTFWWPHMRADVGRWCRACLICASARIGPHYRAPLKPIPIGGPFERVGVDVLSLPPTARGNSKVVVFIDYLTKWVECVPTADETADTIARLFIEHVVCRHGCPNELLSDRGPAFMSNLLAEVLKQCRVKKLNTSGWNPRCNGETERMNRTLIAMLKKTCAETTLDWDDQLPFVVFMYHNVEQASTQATPFALLFGRTCRMPTSTALHYRRPRYQLEPGTYAEQLQQHMAESWEVARGFVERAQQRQKLHYDKNSRSRRYQVGERAFVHMPLETLNKDRKLSRPNYGPYEITAISDTNADLQLVDDDQVRLSVALDRLRPCYKEVPNISYTGRSKRRYVRRQRKEARAVGDGRGQSRECEPAADQEQHPYNLRSRQK